MDDEFTGIPNDERIRRVCELIEGAIERSRLYRKSVLVPPPPPTAPSHLYPKTSPSASATAATATLKSFTPSPTAAASTAPTTTTSLTLPHDVAPTPRRSSAPKRRLSPTRQAARGAKNKKRLLSEKSEPLPPLRDRLLRHMSTSVAAAALSAACDRPSHSASMGHSRLAAAHQLRSRTSTELSLGASMSRKELRSPASTANASPAPTSPFYDSKMKRADGKKARWNPVPQATLMRAHIRAEAAERRAMQTFPEGHQRDTRRRLSEMLSWDPKNKCFLPPQATLMRALARQKRVEEQRASSLLSTSPPPSPCTFPSRSQRSVSAASYLQRRRTRDVAQDLSGRAGTRSALAGRRLGPGGGGVGGGVGGGGGGGAAGQQLQQQQQQQQAPGVEAAAGTGVTRSVSLSAPVSLVVGLPPVLRRASVNDATRLSSPRQRPNRHRGS